MLMTDKALRKAVRLIEEFRKFDLEMQLQMVLIFLLIADNEGCTFVELIRETGLRSSSVSRNVAALGQTHRKGLPGHDLVVAKEDPIDRRTKQIYLTQKGKLLVKAIKEIIE